MRDFFTKINFKISLFILVLLSSICMTICIKQNPTEMDFIEVFLCSIGIIIIFTFVIFALYTSIKIIDKNVDYLYNKIKKGLDVRKKELIILTLENDLEDALNDENYEKANQIQNKLNKIKKSK